VQSRRVIGRLPSAHDPQNHHEQDRSDQAANKYEPLPLTAQDTAARFISVVNPLGAVVRDLLGPYAASCSPAE
jgi:hypothetical protein